MSESAIIFPHFYFRFGFYRPVCLQKGPKLDFETWTLKHQTKTFFKTLDLFETLNDKICPSSLWQTKFIGYLWASFYSKFCHKDKPYILIPHPPNLVHSLPRWHMKKISIWICWSNKIFKIAGLKPKLKCIGAFFVWFF